VRGIILPSLVFATVPDVRDLFHLGCRRGGPQGCGQAHFGECIDDPFGWIKIIPVGPVAIITRVGVMIVVIPLAESDQRDPPVVAAGIRRAMGLSAP